MAKSSLKNGHIFTINGQAFWKMDKRFEKIGRPLQSMDRHLLSPNGQASSMSSINGHAHFGDV